MADKTFMTSASWTDTIYQWKLFPWPEVTQQVMGSTIAHRLVVKEISIACVQESCRSIMADRPWLVRAPARSLTTTLTVVAEVMVPHRPVRLSLTLRPSRKRVHWLTVTPMTTRPARSHAGVTPTVVTQFSFANQSWTIQFCPRWFSSGNSSWQAWNSSCCWFLNSP